jgi:class 3 adenylate cyclase
MSRMDGVAIVVFSDLVDSTALLARLGDDRMDHVRRAHLEDVADVVGGCGGRVVKTLGDGAMARFESALGALRAAALIQAATERLDADQGGLGIAARVGVAVGEPISDGDDLHGMAVVIASRLCSAAESGEVLVQDLVGALVESRDGVELGEACSYALKGVPAPVQAGGLRWRELAAAAQRTGDLTSVRAGGGVTARAASAGRAPGWPGQELDPVAPHSLSPQEMKQVLAAERGGEPFLAFRDGEGCLRLFVLGADGETRTLGRRPEMDLSLLWDSQVSGLHAELRCFMGEWMLLDDGLSRNGTYINRQRVSARQRLRDGDRIRLGRTVLAFNAAKEQPAGATVTAGALPAPPQLTDTERRILIALCRPYHAGGSAATAASDEQIASEVFLSVDAVKMHVRALFKKFELGPLPHDQKRARVAECALELGLVSPQDLA